MGLKHLPTPVLAATAGGPITRSEVLSRARHWYAQDPARYDGSDQSQWLADVEGNHKYRRDCSGLVSMALHLTSSPSSVALSKAGYGIPIAVTDLRPGDYLTFDADGDGVEGDGDGHVILFESWAPAFPKFTYYGFGGTDGQRNSLRHRMGDFSGAATSPLGGAWPQSDDGGNSAGKTDGHATSAYKAFRYKNIVDDDDVHVVVAGAETYSDNGPPTTVKHAIRRPDGWSGFASVEDEAGQLENPYRVESAVVGGRLHVLAATGGQLYHTIRDANGRWGGWGDVEQVGGAGETGTITGVAAAEVNGDLHVVVATAEGGLRHTIRSSSAHTWTGWGDVEDVAGSIGDAADVAAAGVYNNSTGREVLHVLALNTAGVLHHSIRFPTSWSGMTDVRLGGTGDAGPIRHVGVAAGQGDQLHVVATTAEGRVLHTMRSPNSWAGWGDIEQMAGQIGTPLSVGVASTSTGEQLHVFVGTSDEKVHHTIRRPTSWQPWGDVEQAAGDIGRAIDISAGA